MLPGAAVTPAVLFSVDLLSSWPEQWDHGRFYYESLLEAVVADGARRHTTAPRVLVHGARALLPVLMQRPHLRANQDLEDDYACLSQ